MHDCMSWCDGADEILKNTTQCSSILHWGLMRWQRKRERETIWRTTRIQPEICSSIIITVIDPSFTRSEMTWYLSTCSLSLSLSPCTLSWNPSKSTTVSSSCFLWCESGTQISFPVISLDLLYRCMHMCRIYICVG